METVKSEIGIVMSSQETNKGTSKENDKDESKGDSFKLTMTGDREPLGKQQKRTHSEVSGTSVVELNMLHEQLDTLTADLKVTNESIKKLMTKDGIEELITKTVNKLLGQLEEKNKIKKYVDIKIEEKVKEKTTKLNDRLDHMTYENGEIKDRLDKVEEDFKNEKEETKSAIESAIEKSNYNEQYSRKNNVNILGIVHLRDETESKLRTEVLSIVKEKTDVDIDQSEIVAIQRIPSILNPKPELIKFTNNSVKTRLMKHRRVMKQQGHTLVDDVNERNIQLISRLLDHERIDSGWFF